MGKRQPHTPNSAIRAAMRRLFLRSRERARALKQAGYTCQRCGVKQSRAKGREVYVEVHHNSGVCNWEALFAAVRCFLLCPVDDMVCLCKECHAKVDNEKG